MGDVLACQPRGPEFKSPNAGFVFKCRHIALWSITSHKNTNEQINVKISDKGL